MEGEKYKGSMDFNAPKQPNKKSNISFVQSTNKYSDKKSYKKSEANNKHSND